MTKNVHFLYNNIRLKKLYFRLMLASDDFETCEDFMHDVKDKITKKLPHIQFTYQPFESVHRIYHQRVHHNDVFLTNRDRNSVLLAVLDIAGGYDIPTYDPHRFFNIAHNAYSLDKLLHKYRVTLKDHKIKQVIQPRISGDFTMVEVIKLVDRLNKEAQKKAEKKRTKKNIPYHTYLNPSMVLDTLYRYECVGSMRDKGV